ncbi:DUF1007 family protein [Paracoccus beibuensis]|uniref:DUF1007 family protein n=1 Tax=Paracoccus beibuensis TaxID=547602 RepID=UPI0022406FF1|nr:DUF1007 family protein [Paracoccus beibuensis]
MPLRRLVPCLLFPLLPAAAAAHPHVFIDAALNLDYNAAGLAQVTVEWTYDDLYSLLIIEDLDLDPDGDGILMPHEEARLQGFDADWGPGFDGSLYLQVDGDPVDLGPPHSFDASYRDGRLVSRHVRPLATPLPVSQPLLIQVYDPEYYVQFSVPQLPRIHGAAGCDLRAREGDPFAAADAYARAVADSLAEGEDASAAEILEVDIGSVGADEIRVTCGSPS